MNFAVRLGADVVPIEPGATIPVEIEVVNRGDELDRFELSVEGLDPEWTAIPVPAFVVEAHDSTSERIFFKPSRDSESLSGDYPFVAKVRSLVSGEVRTAQGVLHLKSYAYLSMEISPKKGFLSASKHENFFHLTILNLGNSPHTVSLVGTDPENELAFDFNDDEVTVAPGQTKIVEVSVYPTAKRSLSSPKLYGFSVNGRSQQSPNAACSAGAQLEVRPLLAVNTLLAAVVLGVLFVAWFLMLPKNPEITSLNLDRTSIKLGESINLSWKSAHANKVQISLNGNPIFEGASLEGTKIITPTESGKLMAIAMRDGKRSEPLFEEFQVVVPENPPDPVIMNFEVSRREVKLGDTIRIRYRLNDAVIRAMLLPDSVPLDKSQTEVQVTAKTEGEIAYTIIAENVAGKTTTKKISVRVVDLPESSIVRFVAEPAELEPGGGDAKIVWQVSKAARVELSDGQATTSQETIGEAQVSLEKTRTYTLTAYDVKGKSVSKKLTIRVKELPKNPDQPSQDIPPPTASPTVPPVAPTTKMGPGGQR